MTVLIHKNELRIGRRIKLDKTLGSIHSRIYDIARERSGVHFFSDHFVNSSAGLSGKI